MKEIESFVAQARQDRDVLAVILYGSQARGDAGPRSDTDVCLVLRDGFPRDDLPEKALIVPELRLGLPAEEDDVLTKLLDRGYLSARTVDALRRMKGFRTILVHEYGVVEDRIVYEAITHQLGDLDRFADEARAVLGRGKEA